MCKLGRRMNDEKMVLNRRCGCNHRNHCPGDRDLEPWFYDKDFYLGNPKGFKSADAMKVGSIYVDVDEGSVTGETIIIDKIEVVGPDISYEKARGTDNFKTILKNITKAAVAGKSSKKQAQQEAEEKRILIRDFIVRKGIGRSYRQGQGATRPVSSRS